MDSSTTPLQDTSQISGYDSSSIDMDRFSCRSSAYQSASTIRIQPSASSNSDVSLVRSSSIATLVHNAEHSGDLGMATKEPWKGRPAAIGRVLLRLVNFSFGLRCSSD